MMRMEYMTPSGSPPNSRIRTVRKPAPNPKIAMPRPVIGVVTRSVAMKRAPNRNPPDSR